MATKAQCKKCPERLDCPILEAIKIEEAFREKCTEYKRNKNGRNCTTN